MEFQRVRGLSALLFLVDFNFDFDFELDDDAESGWSSEYDRNFFDFRAGDGSDLGDLVDLGLDLVDLDDFDVFDDLDLVDLGDSDFVDFGVLGDFGDFSDFDCLASDLDLEDLDESETGPLASDSPYFAANFNRLVSRRCSFLDFLSSLCCFFLSLYSSLIFFSFARNFLIVGSISKTAIFSRIRFRRTNIPRCGGHRK